MDLIIETADTVRWDWGGGEHNVVSGRPGFPDGHFDSGDPNSDLNTVFEVHFTPGFLDDRRVPANVYPYFCEVGGELGRVAVSSPPCAMVDFNHDGDVDLADFAEFQQAFGPP